MLVKLKEESNFLGNAEISNVGFQMRKLSVKTRIGQREAEESSTKRRELLEIQGQRNGIACGEKDQTICGGQRQHEAFVGLCWPRRNVDGASVP